MYETYLNIFLPYNYKIALFNALSFARSTFRDNLCSVTLGGSGGKGNIIEGWSDLDLYLVLRKYNQNEVSEFVKNISKLDIHIGTTFYTISEVNYGLIDFKTKVMCYEKQNYRVNPTVYGKDLFEKVSYDEIKQNDLINLPNILHDFRRRYINLKNNKNENVTKSYVKKMLVLIKCILNSYETFSYGYYNSVENLKTIVRVGGYDLTPIKQFDILNSIKNMENSKNDILKFSLFLLNFIEYDYKKRGDKGIWKKESVQEQ